LVDKEEELAAMKRENKFLHSELEHLRLLSTRRLASSSPSAANGTKGGGGGLSALPSTGNYSNNNNNARLKPINNADKAVRSNNKSSPVNTSPPDRYNPSRYKPTIDRPNDIAFMMSKDEAKMVILSEVRRLKDSHAVLQANRNQLNNKVR